MVDAIYCPKRSQTRAASTPNLSVEPNLNPTSHNFPKLIITYARRPNSMQSIRIEDAVIQVCFASIYLGSIHMAS